MSDFDFDELDKAVSGALNSDTAQNDTGATPTPVEPARVFPASPVAREVQSAPEVPSRSTPPAARRSSGRFMDVVHPSSDMRSRVSPPLQSAAPAPTTFTPPVDEPVSVSLPEPETDTLEASAAEWSQPLETPFLPDAKVEKRPLGGFGPIPSSFSLSDESDDELKLEAPDELRLEATTMPDPIDFAAQSGMTFEEVEDTTPANDFIQSVESEVEASAEAEFQEDSATLYVEPTERVAEEPIAPVEPIVAPILPEPKPAELIREAPVGPTSITQQYTEQPASNQQVSGAIYDTENYHQPLVHGEKKHSGTWSIVWIVLLVIFGGAAGVGFYFFVLPLL